MKTIKEVIFFRQHYFITIFSNLDEYNNSCGIVQFLTAFHTKKITNI